MTFTAVAFRIESFSQQKFCIQMGKLQTIFNLRKCARTFCAREKTATGSFSMINELISYETFPRRGSA